MVTPDFIYTSTGLARPRKKINWSPEEINMLTRPEEGHVMIRELYKYCSADMPTRFLYILCWFSSPHVDYMAVKDSQDVDSRIKACFDQWEYIYQQHDENESCVCSHVINDCRYYENRLNHDVLRIGNECINKFSDTEMCRQNKIVNKIMRKCWGCKERVVCTKIRGGYCPTCVKGREGLYKRVCLSCLELRNCIYPWRCNSCTDLDKPRLLIVDQEWERTCCKCNILFYFEKEVTMCPLCTEEEEVRLLKIQERQKFIETLIVHEDDKEFTRYNIEQQAKRCSTCKETFYSKQPTQICSICDKKKKDAIREETAEALRKWEKTMLEKQQLSSHKNCSSCDNFFLPKGEWHKVCHSCFHKESIPCRKCSNLFLPKSIKHQLCHSCWKATSR